MLLAYAALLFTQAEDRLVIDGAQGPGKGRHVVFLAGDEEYRSEEGLPQIAKILARRHGFKCTVLFSLGSDGAIDPERHDHQPGLEVLKSADLCVMLLRFREWPEAQMKHFADYLASGKPILALRTSTHAFANPSGAFERFGWQSKTWPGGFGKQVLGETWLSHWGEHGKQATRGVRAASHPVLNGVDEVFGTTDVYEAHPPADAEILMRGEVVQGMSPGDPPATNRKKSAEGIEHEVNDPMMPILWTRVFSPTGTRVLTCTMGAATDFLNADLRRLLVNGAYWLTGLPVPPKAEVELVGSYEPSPFGFGKYRRGVRPRDFAEPPAN